MSSSRATRASAYVAICKSLAMMILKENVKTDIDASVDVQAINSSHKRYERKSLSCREAHSEQK